MNRLVSGCRSPQQPQQVDELLAVDVVPGQPQVEVFLVVGAIRPQDVQPLAAAAHAHQEPLPHQQPAGIHQVQAPDGMAGIHEVPPRVRGASWRCASALCRWYFLTNAFCLSGSAFHRKPVTLW